MFRRSKKMGALGAFLGLFAVVATFLSATMELHPRPTEAAGQQAPAAGDLDLAESRVYIWVPKAGLGHDHAIEGKLKSGKLTLNASEDAGELVFDMTSFDADTDTAREYVGLGGKTAAGTRREVNANMLGAGVLNVRRFPTAKFVIASSLSTKERGKNGTIYELTGKFTLHGVTRPLTVQGEAEEADGKIHLRGSFPLVQTQYGIRPFSKAFGAVGVADQLTTYADLWLAAGK